MEFTFKTVFRYFLAALCVCLILSAHAQTEKKAPLFIEKGIMLGYGNGIDSLNLPEGKYRVYYFAAHFGIDVFRNNNRKKLIPGKCIIYFEPQVNPVVLKSNQGNIKNIELGLNVGFQHLYPLIKNVLSSYILIASGPQYVSVHTSRQRKGFIFSDNFGAGVYLFAKKNMAINLGFRLRHMSNGDTRSPNQGINTFNYFLGISKFIH